MTWRKTGHTQTIISITFTCAHCLVLSKTGILSLRRPTSAFHSHHDLTFLILIKDADRKTAPGGYVEFQDYGCEVFTSDGTMLLGECPDHPIGTYFHHVMGAAGRAGRPLVVARGIKDRLVRAGFVDVVEKTAIWPLGPWPRDKHLKELGKWGRMGTMESLYPFATQLLTREGWTMKDVRDLCESVKEAHDRGKYYCHGWFVYGRKPRAGEGIRVE